MTIDQWRSTASTDRPGWLAMPRLGDEAADAAWLADRIAGARVAFGERWSDQHEQLVPELLRAGLDRREQGDLFAWQVWPLALPIFATVQARIMPSGLVPRWSEHDGSLQPISSAGLGEGVQLLATAPLPGYERAVLGSTAFVFDDGDSAVMIALAPTPQELMALAASGLRQVVDRMEVTRPDGSRFIGLPSERFVVEADGWHAQSGPSGPRSTTEGTTEAR
ncbi:hypothetical protein [Agrococcus beijingensis]|uniref:hypothetical protein n=1 Tax=Agrococcus beijingensis TaxID=3068634 RepID=UPI002742474B|nr:hypothetical protein [Agrococcus sp. REN33]